MKKLFSILLIGVFFSVMGCTPHEEEITAPSYCYSDNQKRAVSNFTGTFADIQFSNLSGSDVSYLLPDPDKIIFKTPYKETLHFDENYLNPSMLSEAHGECTYCENVAYENRYENTECYYHVSCDVSEFSLYYKGGNKDKKLMKRFELSITNETKFTLHDKELTLPYIFVKQ